MKQILFFVLIIAFIGCKKEEKKDPSFTYGKSFELYYNAEIPAGGKIYIDDLVLTAKDFVGATKDSGRYSYPNGLISTTNKYNGATPETNFQDRMICAGTSLYQYISKYNNNVQFKYSLTPQPYYPSVPAYLKFRISGKDGAEIKIKTENYPVTITVLK